VVLHDLDSASVQHASTPVVSESRPGGEHLIFSGRSQFRHVGKAIEEAVVMVYDGRYARLLQHDFA
jgi:hypothetical protein